MFEERIAFGMCTDMHSTARVPQSLAGTKVGVLRLSSSLINDH